MELNITRFFNECSPMDYSASIAEIGNDAGKTTWQAAKDDSSDYMLLDTDDKRDAFRTFVKSSGGWTEDEIAAWSDIELNALLLQWVAGDIREGFEWEHERPEDVSEWEWYEQLANDGLASGRLFKSEDNQVYFYIGD